MPSFQDLTGQRFGKLTVIRRAENGASGRVQWLCQCECGNTPVVIASNMKRGKTGACFECWKAGNKNRLAQPSSWAHHQRAALGTAFASAGHLVGKSEINFRQGNAVCSAAVAGRGQPPGAAVSIAN